MNDSFTLLSTMSPKTNKTYKYIAHQKVPTKLALRKNIRRSSVFDNFPPTVKKNNLILVEGTTDTTSSGSSHTESNIINSTPIIISDSDSESENCGTLTNSSNIDNKLKTVQNNYGLSETKFNAIDKWVSKVNSESEKIRPSSPSIDVHKDADVAKGQHNFDELINSINRTLRLQESDTNGINKSLGQQVNNHFSSIGGNNYNHKTNNFISKNNLITKKNVKGMENSNASGMVTTSNKANVGSLSESSSDIIEDSDDNFDNQSKSAENILNELYGDKWRDSKNLFTRSEPRNRKKGININKDTPKSEMKYKPKWSIVHKNPYLDSQQKLQNTPSTQKETPWARRLQSLCDSDSSEQTLEEVSRARLSFNDKDSDNEDKSSINKFLNDKNYDVASFGKLSSHLSTEKKSDKNAHNVDISKDSGKENFSDFSNDSDTLEDRLRKKLGLDEKRKFPISLENKFKETENNLKDILNKKGKNLKSTNIFNNDICSEANLINNKLPIKTDICRKKTTVAKTKVVRKKPHTSVSESSVSGRKNKTDNDYKSAALKNVSKVHSDDSICNSFLASLSGNVPLSQCDPSARIFRNNFKLYRSELTTKLFKLYNEKIFDNLIPEDSPIEWSERMRGTAGYCYCKTITRRTGLIERKVRLVLAAKILDSADRLRDTLVHEMCHAATWIVNKVADAHGSYWRAWASKARNTFPELPPIKVCHSYKIATKYTYKCTDCGYSFGRHSKSLNVERKYCGYCYGTFEILINKTTKDGETRSVPVTPKKATGFALFVKENYATYKTPQLNHGQVMKLLGQKFGELKV